MTYDMRCYTTRATSTSITTTTFHLLSDQWRNIFISILHSSTLVDILPRMLLHLVFILEDNALRKTDRRPVFASKDSVSYQEAK